MKTLYSRALSEKPTRAVLSCLVSKNLIKKNARFLNEEKKFQGKESHIKTRTRAEDKWENMCSGGNCGKRFPFSIGMAMACEKSREGRKKNEEEEDKEMSDPVDEKHVKTRNRKCVFLCGSLYLGIFFPRLKSERFF